jgi:hypothetical protein
MRKSAGTHGFVQVIRHALGGPPGDPRADLEFFTQGGTIAVQAFRRAGTRLQRGQLAVSPSSVTWRPRFGSAISLVPPFELNGVGFVNSTAVNSHMFRLVSVTAAARSWEFAVPMTDVPLVSAALEPPSPA